MDGSHLLVAEASEQQRHGRPELFVHALAQLPDDVALHIRGAASDRDRLKQLGEAYGVDARLGFDATEDDATRCEPVHAPLYVTMAELVGSLAGRPGTATCPRGRDDVFAGQRIAIVTNLPTHYRVPLFNRISCRLAAAGAHLRVFFTAKPPASRSWMAPEPIEFDHEMLSSTALRIGMRDIPLTLGSRLRSFSPSLVLVPGFSPAIAVHAALVARHRGVPYGIWSGAIPTPRTRRGELRQRQRRALLRHSSFAISYGHLSAEYMRELAPDLPIVYGRNTAPVSSQPPPAPDADTPVEVLAVAQAIPRKGLDVVIAAFEQLRDAPCRLTVIGGGAGLDELRRRARGIDNVRLLGAMASDRTLQAYREAEIFLFPTRFDVFGLVLVEAMGAGLATIASNTCGAIADLALTGENCVVIDGHDPTDWAAAIRALVYDPKLRMTLGREAQETIRRRWTLDHAADAMVAGLRLGVLADTRREIR